MRFDRCALSSVDSRSITFGVRTFVFCWFVASLQEIQFLISEENIFAAKSDTGKRTGPQVPNNHEEPCQKIRHSGETKIETKKNNRRMKGKYKDVDNGKYEDT